MNKKEQLKHMIGLVDDPDFLHFMWLYNDELMFLRSEKERALARAEAKAEAIAMIKGE